VDHEPNGTFRMPSLVPKTNGMVMNGLINVIVYTNDILLYSKNHFEHREQLEKLLNRLRNAGPKVILAKCE
jgi:hypothetical protein